MFRPLLATLLLTAPLMACGANGEAASSDAAPRRLMSETSGAALVGRLQTREGTVDLDVHAVDAREGVLQRADEMRAHAVDARLHLPDVEPSEEP